MKLHEFKNTLAQKPEAQVRFRLPTGDLTPAHIHVTEVARIDKRFIDCGGTLRNDSLCRLQTWFADDTAHRLTAGKLTKIFAMAERVALTDDLDVDVEHEVGHISQFPVESAEVSDNEIVFRLTERHTACLAMDKCLPPAALSKFSPLKFNFTDKSPVSKCCGLPPT